MTFDEWWLKECTEHEMDDFPSDKDALEYAWDAGWQQQGGPELVDLLRRALHKMAATHHEATGFCDEIRTALDKHTFVPSVAGFPRSCEDCEADSATKSEQNQNHANAKRRRKRKRTRNGNE